MSINNFEQLKSLENTPKMPVLFLGHGSPMSAIEPNEFTQRIEDISKKIPIPSAILCISAHWETQGSWLTAMLKPKTIHDFYGFPAELYAQQYPAPGSPELANFTQQILLKKHTDIKLDNDKWGLDHGTWSVLKYLYPKAHIPVVQLSLDQHKSAQQHYKLAQQLSVLRHKGVLIIGSGNIVHNLRMLSRYTEESFGFDWALEADETVRQAIIKGNHDALINIENQGEALRLAIPTPEHYWPLLYTLALQEKSDSVHLFNEKPLYGALSMTSVALGI